MKKRVSLLLAAAMTLTALTGCSSEMIPLWYPKRRSRNFLRWTLRATR